MRLTLLEIAHQMATLMDEGGAVEPRMQGPVPASFASSAFTTRALPFPSDSLLPWAKWVKDSMLRWEARNGLGLERPLWRRLKAPVLAGMERMETWTWNQSQKRQTELAQALFEAWTEAGYLPRAPRAQLTTSSPALSAMATHRLGVGAGQTTQPHTVAMNVRRHGQVVGKLEEPMAPSHVATHPLRRPTTPMFRLWLVLGHEAGHTLFEGEACPFQPSPSSSQTLTLLLFNAALHPHLTQSQKHQKMEQMRLDVNRHEFGPGAFDQFAAPLEEAFCDVFGAMLLLRSTQFHPQALAEVRLHQAVRSANTTHHRQMHGNWLAKDGIYLYDTSLALELALARQAQWATVAPADLRQHALTIASDAWLVRAAREMSRYPGLRAPLSQLPMDKKGWPGITLSLEAALCQGVSHARHVWCQWAPALHASPGHRVWDMILNTLESPAGPDQPLWATQVKALLAQHPSTPSLEQNLKLQDRLSPLLQAPMDAHVHRHAATWQAQHRVVMKTVVRWAEILGPALEQELAAAPVPSPVQLPEPSRPRRRLR